MMSVDAQTPVWSSASQAAETDIITSPPRPAVIESGIFKGAITLQEQLRRMEEQDKKKKLKHARALKQQAKVR